MRSPLVSIGLPVFNGESALRRALDSALSQDFEDFELIISDNASTDTTQMICESYAKMDRRLRYFRNVSNIGVSPNHNRVFELSSGQYFSWLAHDVEYLPGMLTRCLKEFRSASHSPVLVYPRCQLIDDGGEYLEGIQRSIASRERRPYRRVIKVIHNVNYITQHYGLFLADCLKKTRLNGSYASSDYVLTAEMAMLGEIREVPEVLLRRTISRSSGTEAVRHSQKAWSAWLDPAGKAQRSFLPLRERLAWEYLKSTWFLPLKPMDKLPCLVAVVFAHYRRIFLRKTGPVRNRLRRLTAR